MNCKNERLRLLYLAAQRIRRAAAKRARWARPYAEETDQTYIYGLNEAERIVEGIICQAKKQEVTGER